MPDLKTYENIVVSGFDYDFSRSPYESIPYAIFVDWISLVIKIAKEINPDFDIPPLPERFEFKNQMIHSDGPYSASEDYYTLDYVYYQLTGKRGYGIRISFENGRWDGDNSIALETLGLTSYDSTFQPNFITSSYIPKSATSPVARFFVWHLPEQTAEIETIFALHQENCLLNTTR